MAHFFSVYKALEGKETVAKDVNDRAAAVEVIRKAMGALCRVLSRRRQGQGGVEEVAPSWQETRRVTEKNNKKNPRAEARGFFFNSSAIV